MSRDQQQAIAAHCLYLLNLLALPGVGLLLLWLLARQVRGPLARQHAQASLLGSWWAMGLLLGVTGLALGLGGVHSLATWVVVLVYLTSCHSLFVMLGVVGLARALAGQPWRFPLPGRRP